jgi:hypothetical protein
MFEFYRSNSEVRILVTNAKGTAAAQAATAKLALPHAATTTLVSPAGPLHLTGFPDTKQENGAEDKQERCWCRTSAAYRSRRRTRWW